MTHDFCFLCPNLDKAVKEASSEIGLITITQKNLDKDLTNICEKSYYILQKYNLNMEHKFFDKADGSFLMATLLHAPSFEKLTRRYAFFDEKSATYAAIKACIDLLQLEIINDDIAFNNLGLDSRNTNTISFTDIENYFKCSRCFYFTKKGIRMPFVADEQFDIPNANDVILKKEFDTCRKMDVSHPIMKKNKIDAVPLKNTNIDKWRNSNYGNGGIRVFDPNSNIIFSGVVDDIWINQQGEFIIVDYKTTIKESISLEDEIGARYCRQISFYGWLFKKNNYPVHSIGYLIIDKPQVNLHKDLHQKQAEKYSFSPFISVAEYQRLLKFETTVLKVSLDDSWIEETLTEMIKCLNSADLPIPFRNKRKNKACATCEYHFKIRRFEDNLAKKLLPTKTIEN